MAEPPPVGPELDVAIAQRLGWTLLRRGRVWHYGTNQASARLPRWSTDDATALGLLTRWRDCGMERLCGEWACWVGDATGPTWTGVGDTLAAAVAKAAWAALGGGDG